MMTITDLTDKEFRGNILIVQKDTVLFEYSHGYADLANEIPNTAETKL